MRLAEKQGKCSLQPIHEKGRPERAEGHYNGKMEEMRTESETTNMCVGGAIYFIDAGCTGCALTQKPQ